MEENVFHRPPNRGPYFEGWYFKLQPKQGPGIALIPALHIDPAGKRSASLQIITDNAAWWLDYPAVEVVLTKDPLVMKIGESLFTTRGLRLYIRRPELTLSGALTFGPLTPLRSDIMGPFRFLPGMECVHGVVSMGHTVRGALCLNGKKLDFCGGAGYIETDRGRSFPKRYLWTQCVWQTGSLMLSIATIPLPIGSFTGCICAIHYKGKEIRLATYHGAHIVRWSQTGAVLRQGPYRLEVRLLRPNSHPLQAPVRGKMERTIHESLCAEVSYRLWREGKLLLAHADATASFEYAEGR